MKKLLFSIFSMAMAMLTLATAQTVNSSSKTLVVYFSHAGDNYAVGNIDEGNTKIVADYICEITGAERFEISTDKYDGMAYKPLCDLARQEKVNDEHPEYVGDIDTAPYDVIFIGGPVWWGTYPRIMFTFFARHNLNGKILIPFTTHEGSGLGSCVTDLKKAYPNANVTGEFEIYGHQVRQGRQQVETWLASLMK